MMTVSDGVTARTIFAFLIVVEGLAVNHLLVTIIAQVEISVSYDVVMIDTYVSIIIVFFQILIVPNPKI